MSADEFLIAADLTLYSNPLNRALLNPLSSATKSAKSHTSAAEVKASSKPSDTEKASGSKEAEKKNPNDESDTWIASDMTKYDCPLAALDKTSIFSDKFTARGISQQESAPPEMGVKKVAIKPEATVQPKPEATVQPKPETTVQPATSQEGSVSTPQPATTRQPALIAKTSSSQRKSTTKPPTEQPEPPPSNLKVNSETKSPSTSLTSNTRSSNNSKTPYLNI